MKLTQTLLVKLIEEAMEHGGLSCNEVHPIHTHNEWEEHKKEEEKKTKAMAKISIKPRVKLAENEWGDVLKSDREDCISKNELRDILKKWESPDYEVPEGRERYEAYHDDIVELVGESE